MAPPRIFVGTLACGEAELAECRAAVQAQRDVAVTHRVIEDLPELEAHNALWGEWEAAKPQHDLFAKIDADTVLARDTALAELAALFKEPDVTGAQVLLHDFFTDGLIAGLNVFSPAVEFRRRADRLYPDRVDVNHRRVLKGDAVRHLAPIGWHCRAPHPRQAFHFGLHRALKAQWDVLAAVAAAWRRAPEPGREWALLGAAAATGGFSGSFDYRSQGFEREFAAASHWHDRGQRIEAFCSSLPQRRPSLLRRWMSRLERKGAYS
jgi:hypothetical protein